MDDYNLNQEEIAFFKIHGYVGPFKAYEKDEIEDLWRRVRLKTFDRRNAVFNIGDDGTNPISSYDRHLDIELLGKHVCNPKIACKLRSLLGDNILCWRSEFFPKYPGDEGTDWHQGDTFAGLNGGKASLIWPESSDNGGTVTVWTAFSDVTMDMGPLGVIPGTQRERYYDEGKVAKFSSKENIGNFKNGVKRGFYGYDYRDLQIDKNWSPDESKAVHFTMKKGEFMIFLSTLVHGSLPHLGETNLTRMGYVSRYVPTEVKVYPELDELCEFDQKVPLSKYGAVLVCGEDEYKHNRIRTHDVNGVEFIKVF
jgi:non-heme Fe2+,alpha-ketoglutarate-dependent halogenase